MSEKSLTTLGLLCVMLIGLKLCHVINWSWWWVTVPFWGGFAVVMAIFIVLLIGAALSSS